MCLKQVKIRVIKFKNITGSKIKLIDLDLKHLDDMFEYSSDARLYEYLEFEPHKKSDDTKVYLKNLIKRSNQQNAHWWFIQLRDTLKVIGSFGIHDIDMNRNSCEISYALSPKYWGKKIFSDVMKLALDYLVKDLSFHRIMVVTAKNNVRSIGAIKKFKFEQEGILKDYYHDSDNKRYDAAIFSLVQKG